MPHWFYLVSLATAWLGTLAGCVAAIRWGIRGVPGRFWASAVCAGGAMTVGYIGLTRFNVSYVYTANGTSWSLNSKWFFAASIGLGLLAAAVTLWRLACRRPKMEDTRGPE
jgi:hypothetical protein